MKIFQVSAIMNAQLKRIETFTREDNSRFAMVLANKTQQQSKGSITIPNDPVESGQLPSDYIKNSKKNNQKKKSSGNLLNDILEENNFIFGEDLVKLYILKKVIINLFERELKLFVPDVSFFGNQESYKDIYTQEKATERMFFAKALSPEKILNQKFSEENSTQYTISVFKCRGNSDEFDEQKVEININDRLDSKLNFVKLLDLKGNEHKINIPEYFDSLSETINIAMDNLSGFNKLECKIPYEGLTEIVFDDLCDPYLQIDGSFYKQLRVWSKDKSENNILIAIGHEDLGLFYVRGITNLFTTKNINREIYKEKNHIDITL